MMLAVTVQEVDTRRRSQPSIETDDARLIDAIRGGSRSAEEQLYRRHAPSVLRLATRLLRSTEAARDVLQDTFLLAFEELPRLRDTSALSAWLHTLCVRQAHRRFRRRRLLRAIGLDATTEDATLERQAAPDLDPEERAELRSIDRALDTLPSNEKIAWVLRHVEGMSLEEVAHTCECSLATVKRRIGAAETTVNRIVQETP